MLLRFDPFRELDRLWEATTQAPATPRSMPMNAVRRGESLVVSFDLPGIRREDVELTVERNQLTVTAERQHQRADGDEWLVAERPAGRWSRQLLLGDNLDTEHIEASFRDGVLEVTIPVAEQAKPRRVEIGGHGDAAIEATSTAA